MLVDMTHKTAAKAAIARLVASRGRDPGMAAWGVQDAQEALNLKTGDTRTVWAKKRYALGVARNGERVSNRRWSEYTDEVRLLATVIADLADAAIGFTAD